MHSEGKINLGFREDSRINGLEINRTTTRSITIAGSLNNDGKCQGINNLDPYKNWEDVVVQGSAKITLQTSYVPVHLNTGKIYLKSGTGLRPKPRILHRLGPWIQFLEGHANLIL